MNPAPIARRSALPFAAMAVFVCMAVSSARANPWRSPLLDCKEMYIVKIVSATPAVDVDLKDPHAFPGHEIHQTVRFMVERVILGKRKVGEQFDYPTVAYDLFGSDRPTTPWDMMQLDPGRKFLFAPGDKLEWNKDLPTVHDVPLVLEEVPSALKPIWQPFRPPDVDDIAAFLTIRDLPADQQGPALRKRLAANAFTRFTADAARQLFAQLPDRADNAKAIGEFILRPDIDKDARREWTWFLDDMPNRRADPPLNEAGNRQIVPALWHLLARGAPPADEDIRVDLNSVITLTDLIYRIGGYGTDPSIPPDQFVPKDIDLNRVHEALEYLRTHDNARYGYPDGHVENHDSRVDKLIQYLAPAGPTTAPAIPPGKG
jgi:hypothetical protein